MINFRTSRRTALVSRRTRHAVLVPSLRCLGQSPAATPPDSIDAADRLDRVGGGFECATVRVPLDYDQPDGTKIELDLIRLRASDPDERIGSLFMNPGGPGGSGVDLIRGIAPFMPPELKQKFDLVGFDPRGIMRSTPLLCFDSLEEAIDVLPPFAFPCRAARRRSRRPRTTPWPTLARTAAAPSATTCRPRMSRATWMSCGRGSATTS